MRYRPLCPAFVLLMLIIFLLRSRGLWSIPSFYEDEISQMEQCLFVTGTIQERQKSEDGYQYVLSNTTIETKDARFHPGKIRISKTERFFKVGTVLKTTGKCSFYEHESNPGGFNSKSFYAAEGILCRFTIKSVSEIGYDKRFALMEAAAVWREKLSEIYTEAMGDKRGAILSAMITGNRSGIEEETRLHYTVSGLGHLLAISGLHVGIVGMALLRLLIVLRLKRSVASLLSAGILFFYCLFTGAQDSTLRAFIMFSVMVVARCLLRSYDMPSSLCFAGILLLLLRPQRLFVAGFLLSFGAVAGLAFFYPVLKKAFPLHFFERGIKHRFFLALYEGFFVWLSVNLVTLPVQLWFYSEYAVYGVLANVFLVPLTALVILFGIAGGLFCLIFPFLGRMILIVSNTLIFIQEGIGSVFQALPYNRTIVGRPNTARLLFYYAGILILMTWLKKRGESRSEYKTKEKWLVPACAILLMTLIFIRPYHGFSITALDVGQGDGIVITDGKNHTVLIDGGSSSVQQCGKNTILPYLKAEGIHYIDGIFVSHNDADHMNGILEILEMKADGSSIISIGKLFLPLWMKQDEVGSKLTEAAKKCGTEIYFLKEGSKVRLGDVTYYVLFPPEDKKYTGNEGSLVLGLTYQGFCALFTGDIEGEAENALAKKIGHYDYLKIAHHGSSSSTSEAFLKAVKPLFCLISAPKNSLFNHPSPDTIKRIEEAEASWLQTGKSGAVTVRFRNGKMSVRTYL